ncbi:MAG: hypothetical protein JXB07_08235 [Anaerolineae bacterium]|nr:hypothetical protein [Anaerolineae bacterium]
MAPQQPEISTPPAPHIYSGANLTGWQTVVGDAQFACPDEPPITLGDIQTLHYSDHSALEANIQPRAVMAHNITFKRVIDDSAFDYVHTFSFGFRLPHELLPDVGASYSAETFEGGIFIWDGSQTRLDYGAAFQWVLNPWSNTGKIYQWDEDQWVELGYLPLDTDWHDLTLIVDYPREEGILVIDDISYAIDVTTVTKPMSWGTETAARIQLEAISVYPGQSCMKAKHQVEIKDWQWQWEPAQSQQ